MTAQKSFKKNRVQIVGRSIFFLLVILLGLAMMTGGYFMNMTHDLIQAASGLTLIFVGSFFVSVTHLFGFNHWIPKVLSIPFIAIMILALFFLAIIAGTPVSQY